MSVSSLSNIVKRWTSKRERDQPIRWWGFKKFCWLWMMTWPGHKENDKALCEDKKKECERTQRSGNCRAIRLNFVWASLRFPMYSRDELQRERDQPWRWRGFKKLCWLLWGFRKFCWLWIVKWLGHKRNDQAWCEDKKRECEGTQRLENCRATRLNFVWGSPHFPI